MVIMSDDIMISSHRQHNTNYVIINTMKDVESRNVAGNGDSGFKTAGLRGPAEHERRQQIVQAANEHFRHYGYKRTTVADLAKAIHLSTAYIYKFFESKQAIGDAVCSLVLSNIISEMNQNTTSAKSAAEALRHIYRVLVAKGRDLFFRDREMHDVVTASLEEKWHAVKVYEEQLLEMIRAILLRGREAGEFERKTPLDETCRAILQTMLPFAHPILLEQNLDRIDEDAIAVANLVLRSLSL